MHHPSHHYPPPYMSQSAHHSGRHHGGIRGRDGPLDSAMAAMHSLERELMGMDLNASHHSSGHRHGHRPLPVPPHPHPNPRAYPQDERYHSGTSGRVPYPNGQDRHGRPTGPTIHPSHSNIDRRPSHRSSRGPSSYPHMHPAPVHSTSYSAGPHPGAFPSNHPAHSHSFYAPTHHHRARAPPIPVQVSGEGYASHHSRHHHSHSHSHSYPHSTRSHTWPGPGPVPAPHPAHRASMPPNGAYHHHRSNSNRVIPPRGIAVIPAGMAFITPMPPRIVIPNPIMHSSSRPRSSIPQPPSTPYPPRRSSFSAKYNGAGGLPGRAPTPYTSGVEYDDEEFELSEDEDRCVPGCGCYFSDSGSEYGERGGEDGENESTLSSLDLDLDGDEVPTLGDHPRPPRPQRLAIEYTPGWHAGSESPHVEEEGSMSGLSNDSLIWSDVSTHGDDSETSAFAVEQSSQGSLDSEALESERRREECYEANFPSSPTAGFRQGDEGYASDGGASDEVEGFPTPAVDPGEATRRRFVELPPMSDDAPEESHSLSDLDL